MFLIAFCVFLNLNPFKIDVFALNEQIGENVEYNEVEKQKTITSLINDNVVFLSYVGTLENAPISFTVDSVGNQYKEIYFMISNMSKVDDINSYSVLAYKNHNHNRNGGCVSINGTNHTSVCSCGVSFTEAHQFQVFKYGHKCKHCGYYTTGPVIVPMPILTKG